MVQVTGMVIAFVAIIVMLNRRLSLGLAMSTAALILVLTSGLPPAGMAATTWQALTAADTIELLLAVLGITMLSAALKRLGYLERAVSSLCDLTGSPRAVTVMAPSLVGLLPVPGGAIISAPLIDDLGASMGMKPEHRAAANMIFRHAWFLVFPFNPHLIVAASLAGLPLATLILAQVPAALVCFGLGWILLFRNTHPESCDLPGAPRSVALLVCLRSLAPLLVALGSYGLFPIALPVALALGVITVLVMSVLDRMVTTVGRAIWREGIDCDLLVTIAAIMLFRAFVVRIDQLPAMVEAMLARGIPADPFLIAVPLVIGFISASQSTAVVVCYPLFLAAAGTFGTFVGFAALIYTAAFIGHMVSPAHPCGPLTASYYRVPFPVMTRAYLPILLGAGAATTAMMIVLRIVA